MQLTGNCRTEICWHKLRLSREQTSMTSIFRGTNMQHKAATLTLMPKACHLNSHAFSWVFLASFWFYYNYLTGIKWLWTLCLQSCNLKQWSTCIKTQFIPANLTVAELTFSWSEDKGGSTRRSLCSELSSSEAAWVVVKPDMCPFLSRRTGSGEPALSSSVSSFMRCWEPSQISCLLLIRFGWWRVDSERQTVHITKLKLRWRSQTGWKKSMPKSW